MVHLCTKGGDSKMSKEEALKWKNKEKELLAEIKSLQKQKDEISRSVRSKDQQIDKLKSVESKHTAEIEALKAKLKSASVKGQYHNLFSKINSDQVTISLFFLPNQKGTNKIECKTYYILRIIIGGTSTIKFFHAELSLNI